MRIQNNTCSRCGTTQYTEYCEFCEPNMVWDYDVDPMQDAPPTPTPSDEELAEMAAYHDELDQQARIDAYDSIDHDYPYTSNV